MGVDPRCVRTLDVFCAVFGGIMFRARVSGPFFAIMTLAMLSAFYTIILDRQAYTGGVNGLTPPSAFQFAGVEIDPYSPAAYWVVFGFLMGATLVAKLITQSSFGLVTQAIREDSERVRFLGYSVAGYETVIYTISGLIAAQSIGFALYRRERTGVGEAIEVPMFENMASFVASEHLGAMTFDPPCGPSGDGRLLSPDYRPLPTKDGYITVAPNNNAQSFAFFDAIGRPELKTDPRFCTAALSASRARLPRSSAKHRSKSGVQSYSRP